MKFRRFVASLLSISLLFTAVFASSKELKKKRDNKLDEKIKIEQDRKSVV